MYSTKTTDPIVKRKKVDTWFLNFTLIGKESLTYIEKLIESQDNLPVS